MPGLSYAYRLVLQEPPRDRSRVAASNLKDAISHSSALYIPHKR